MFPWPKITPEIVAFPKGFSPKDIMTIEIVLR